MISVVRTNKYNISLKGTFKGFNPNTNELLIDDAKHGLMSFNLSDLDSFLDKEVNFSFCNSETFAE